MVDGTKIFIVDDHPIVRQGLVQLIDRESDLTVCGEAEDAPSALEAIRSSQPDLAIVDLSLKTGDGIDLIKNLRSMFPDVIVLVLSMHDEPFYVERALRAGAQGYVTKQDAGDEVLTAVRRLRKGEIFVSDRLSPKLIRTLLSRSSGSDGSWVGRLSDRELQVFRLIGEGRTTRDIAASLNLSVKTIETHRANIKDKLGLDSAPQLVQHAIRWVLGKNDS